MRNVIILHAHLQEKNAKFYAETALVRQELPAVQIIIEKSAHATTLCKETDMCRVLNVSSFYIKDLIRSFCFGRIFIYTILLVPKVPEPECRVDQDCQSNLACIDEKCQNPCRVNNPCTGDQRCIVKDTLPTRTVACVCPDGTVFSDSGNCQRGKNLGE